MFAAIPIDSATDEAHSVYLRQFPFGNNFTNIQYYKPTHAYTHGLDVYV